eukprot:2187569-Rhodomonas_salina.2
MSQPGARARCICARRQIQRCHLQGKGPAWIHADSLNHDGGISEISTGTTTAAGMAMRLRGLGGSLRLGACQSRACSKCTGYTANSNTRKHNLSTLCTWNAFSCTS